MDIESLKGDFTAGVLIPKKVGVTRYAWVKFRGILYLYPFE